jgi:hypothetical protein
MKHFLLASLLLPALLAAQAPLSPPSVPNMPRRVLAAPVGQPTPGETFPDNYQLTLSLTDKDGPPLEVSVVVVSTQFSAMLAEQNLSFSGTVELEESGGILIAYSLGWQAPAPVDKGPGNFPAQSAPSSSTRGSVRLKAGEEMQIIRAGTRSAKLSIKKLEPSKSK